MRKSIFLLLGSLAGLLSLTAPCTAEQFDTSTVLEDTRLYFTAPVRWDAKNWMYFGGALALIGASHQLDRTIRDHFATGYQAVPGYKDTHSTRDAIPAAALVGGTFLYARFVDDQAGDVEAYSMLEAAAFTAVTTEVLKFAAGRERPSETTDVNSWRKSGSSFPSLHASAAFAIGTVFAESGGEEYRWIRRIVGYGVASATAYTRLHENVHWFSDVVAGAVIGIASARFVVNRREEREGKGELTLAPMAGGGAMLSYQIPLR
jgi:membrane-associated phospholipid phosphatase